MPRSVRFLRKEYPTWLVAAGLLLGLGGTIAGCGGTPPAGGTPGGGGPADGRRSAATSGSGSGRAPAGGAASNDPLLDRIRALAGRGGSPGGDPQARTAGSAKDPDGPARKASGANGPDGPASSAGSALVAGLLPPMRGASGTIPLAAPGTASTRSVSGIAGGPRSGRTAASEHVLGAGDEIDLVVAGHPEFSGKVAVRDDGTVALPATGDLVAAEGGTVAELARAVAGAVSPTYVRREPAVSAVLVRSPRAVYHIFGAVRRQGRYEIPPGGVTVLDAVIRATSYSAPAGPGGAAAVVHFEPVNGALYDRVRVVSPPREGGSRSGASPFRLVDIVSAMRGGPEATEPVLAGETVIVPASEGPWSEQELRKRAGGSVPAAPGSRPHKPPKRRGRSPQAPARGGGAR